MYKLGICSLFRDSQNWYGYEINQVANYFANHQYSIEEAKLDGQVKFFCLEGNSKDNTFEVLNSYKEKYFYPIELIKEDVEGSDVVSSENEIRFRNLSKIGNTVLNAAKQECQDILYFESDFIIPANLLSELYNNELKDQWETILAIAPISICANVHYDSWAMRDLDGRKFQNEDLEKLRNYQSRYRPMSSIGSCAFLNGNNLRKYNIDFGEGCFPELCRKGLEVGLQIYCDISLEIQHPSNQLIAGRFI